MDFDVVGESASMDPELTIPSKSSLSLRFCSDTFVDTGNFYFQYLAFYK